MKTERATLHMALACYLADNPDKQVVKLAKRYSRTTKSARTRKTMALIIKSATPALLVQMVYDEEVKKDRFR